jgi:hypothetical protein
VSTFATRPVSGGPADEFMRRLLRVTPATNPRAAREATRAMSSSIFLSAVRCLLTYLVIPVAGPAVHLANGVGRPLGIALCFLAAFFSIRSMRRFWTANHKYRWYYTTFAIIVLAYMAYGVSTDIAYLV